MITKTIISGPDALQGFRDLWTGQRILSLLKKHDGKLLITWPVGVGKSYNIDNVIESGIYENIYDLIIALMPTTAVLQERRWVINPPDDIKIVILRPRPAEMCGPINDELWKVFEQNSMGILGL